MSRVSSRPAALQILASMLRNRKALLATTRIELQKRYAGTSFGLFWVALYPTLLMFVYVFVYMVVFKVRFPGYSEFEYVIYVFSGLVPYLAVWDALTAGAVSIKQNLHLIKNVMLPIEMAPVRTLMTSMVGQLVMTAVVVAMTAYGGVLSTNIVWLPLAFLLEFLFVLGCIFFVSALAIFLTDVAHVVNLVMLLLMFLSPIGFKPEMIPPGLEALVVYNPVYYLTEPFRVALLYSDAPNYETLSIWCVVSLGTFIFGSAFFYRFKETLVDYE